MSPAPASTYEELAPAEAAQVDAVCDAFEQAWRQVQTGRAVPQIASYLDGCTERVRPVLISELVALDQACRERFGVAIKLDEYQEFEEKSGTPERSDTRVDPPDDETLRAGPELWPQLPGLEMLEVLGAGGMGVVFKARQLALDRLVAVKVLRDGYRADAEARARFLQEARAIAILRHSHLVQVYEYGEIPSANGTSAQRYLVLEYVEGGNLADMLDGSPQPPADAARLVETLADAIHYAHEQGIVHRDLKPANVLLTATASPKITDFGLAKFLRGSDLTRTGDVLGTPSYMAPEQTVGHQGIVAPAVDVYGLGAILYEVLTGRPPFLAETAIATVMLVRQDEPIPLRRLQPTVPRDLETICLKCLQKDAGRRYASAQSLADDLRRFRNGEPIRARPVGHGERLVRWCRRQPAVAGLLAALVLVFFVGLSGVAWQWRRATTSAENAIATAGELKRERDKVVEQWERAERNLTRARKLVDRLTRLADDLSDKPGLDQTGRTLFQEALAFHQEVLQEKGTDPAVRLEAARAFGSVADIHHILRQWDLSAAAYRQKIALLNDLQAEFPETMTHHVELAHAHRSLAHALRDSGKVPDARTAYDQAIAIEEELQRENPESGSRRIALANSLLNSVPLVDKQDTDEIERRRLRVVRLQREAVELSPSNRGFRQELSLGLCGIARLHLDRGELPQAEDVSREALTLREQLHGEDPQERWFERYLAASHRQLAGILAVSRPADAEPHFRESVRLLENLTNDFPARPIYRVELAETQVEWCTLLTEPDRLSEVETLIGQAISHYGRLANDHPSEPDHLRKQAAAAYLLGQRLRGSAKYNEAQEVFQKMLAANEQLVVQFKGVPSDRFNRAWDLSLLSDTCELGGNLADAERFLKQSIDELQRLVNDFGEEANYRKALASREEELTRLRGKVQKLADALKAGGAPAAD